MRTTTVTKLASSDVNVVGGREAVCGALLTLHASSPQHVVQAEVPEVPVDVVIPSSHCDVSLICMLHDAFTVQILLMDSFSEHNIRNIITLVVLASSTCTCDQLLVAKRIFLLDPNSICMFFFTFYRAMLCIARTMLLQDFCPPVCHTPVLYRKG